MTLVLMLGVGVAAYMLATKSEAGAPAPETLDPRAREGDGTGVQPDQAGAPVVTATTAARLRTTAQNVQTAPAPTTAANAIPTKTNLTMRFAAPAPTSCADCAQSSQSGLSSLSKLGADVRF